MYQVLYRKWRPTTFSEVCGQDQVTVTLQNELKSGRINHAYLFTGTRGTGKTTCAKILAKAVNCLNPQNGNPCGECEICKGIENGEILDIAEIDAASNNGVDNIRALQDEVAFIPAKAKYRVYIIDEVHMLSAGAFNALLKTLEEPPAHAVFILATTEVHKLPATIISRCQRFDFHRIAPDVIADRLLFIAENEKVVLTRDAALLIASVSDGAFRDSLSLLDRCIGISTNITQELVRTAAGLADTEYIFSITDSITDKDASGALTIIDKLYSQSKDMARLSDELYEHYRNLMLIKTMKDPKKLVVMTTEDYNKAELQAKRLSLKQILFSMQVLQSSSQKTALNRRFELEAAAIKLCTYKAETDSLTKRIEALEKALKDGVTVKEKPAKEPRSYPDGITPTQRVAKLEEQVRLEEAKKAEQPQDEPEKPKKQTADFSEIIKNAVKMENWDEVIKALSEYSTVIASAFEGTDAYISGDYLLIDSHNEIPFQLLRQSSQRENMRAAIRRVTGRNYKLGPYKRKEEQEKAKDPLAALADKLKDAGVELTEI